MAYERSEKEQRFDRQMRLWGGHGQLALEEANICVLGSGATAAETLKNIVLPNVGRFTLVDDAIVTEADCNVNWFCDRDSIGRPRAEVVRDNMKEMNAEVKGEAIIKNPSSLLSAAHLSFFAPFSLVIVCDNGVSTTQCLPLADYLWGLNKPLVLVSVRGLLGTARLQAREHLVVESHPGNDRSDLFVHPQQIATWPELKDFCEGFGVFAAQPAAASGAAAAGEPASSATPAVANGTSSSSSAHPAAGVRVDGEEHAHIPFVAILHQVLTRWTASHGGQLPKTYEEKQAFKQAIKAAEWKTEASEEDNFDQAVEHAYRAYDLPVPDRQVQLILDEAGKKSDEELKAGDKFWILARALAMFRAQEGQGVCLPANTNIPDMHSRSAYYVKLKELFAARAERDVTLVKGHVDALLSKLGLPKDHIDDAQIHMFVRNARTLHVVRTRSLKEEYGSDGASLASAGKTSFATDKAQEDIEEYVYVDEDAAAASSQAEQKPRPKNVMWYLGLRAADLFHARKGHKAGGGAAQTPQQLEADHTELVALQKELLANMGLEGATEADPLILAELVRSGNSEPHVTAAFMGGIASQIALKVTLRQYVPVNHTLLWNGLFASSSTLSY